MENEITNQWKNSPAAGKNWANNKPVYYWKKNKVISTNLLVNEEKGNSQTPETAKEQK